MTASNTRSSLVNQIQEHAMTEDIGTTASSSCVDALAGDQSAEYVATFLLRRFDLSSLHLFTSEIPGLEWRVFASRREPKGIEASCESGGGSTIAEALATLDARLSAGPFEKMHIPILDAPKSTLARVTALSDAKTTEVE